VDLDPGELRVGDRAEDLGEAAELAVPALLDVDAATGPLHAGEEAPGVGAGPVEEGADRELRRRDAEDARAGQAATVASGPTGVRAKPVGQAEEGVLGLQPLHGGVPAVAVHRAEHIIPVVADGPAPAAPLDVIVGVVGAGLGVDAAEEE